MEEFIKIFKALGDETRVNILLLISNRGMCAKGIARHLEISEAAVSQQIKILKDIDLIQGYKIGYHIIYDLNEEKINSSIKFLESIIDNEKTSTTNIASLKCLNGCKHMKCASNNKIKEEPIMKICFPVESNEGVKSIPYGHFGTAPLFVICDLETNNVKSVGNGDLGHEHGKCQPMKALSGEEVDAVVVGGIGAGAINKLNSMGIKVFQAIQGDLEKNLEAFKENKLKEFSSTHVCNHDGCSH
ncbi:metalloregulator ArsR/SmtB family transcription factor [Clostridium sp.]|uniref:metalloregulator ArsR/SmtB family transcription factor n=1 Tax=Clostridium sp. TaxID=1506 RepID=UPI0037BFBB8F